MDLGYLIVLLCVTILIQTGVSRKDRTRSHRRSKTSIADVIDDVCMPKHTDRLVYRFQNDTHIFIGFDVTKKGLFFQMSWEINEHTPEILVKNTNAYSVLPSDDVRAALSRRKILAATNKRQQRIFQKQVDFCQQSVFTKTCLMEAFAESARKMKTIRFDRKCSQKKN